MAKRKKKRPTNPARKKRKRTAADWAPAFLAQLAKTGIIGDAAKVACINRWSFYERRDNDKEFRKQARAAIKESNDAIRLEIRRRGVDGTLRPIYQGKKHVGNVRDFSDTLLIFLAKSRMPEFRDKIKHQHGSDPKKPVMVEQAVTHEHRISPDAFREFVEDIERSGLSSHPGLGDVSRNGHS